MSKCTSAKQARNNNSFLLNRPFSSTGLRDGDTNMNEDGSTIPIDYYIEALEGERLLIARLIIHVVDGGTFDSGSYGNGITLANGMQAFYERNGVKYNITDGYPIKTNVDWGRWCFNLSLSTFGSGNQSLNARWTLTNYGTENGIILESGDKLGIRVNDNMTGLIEQTIIAEGLHLCIPNSEWLEILEDV